MNIELVIYKNNESQKERIKDLTQKTNQFNLTTKRYTLNEVESFLENDLVFTFKATDRFGDSGIVGLAIIKVDKGTANIDTFLLSCRILGRGIEIEFLTQILKDLKNKGVNKVNAQYIPTEKNAQTKDFLAKQNFILNGDNQYSIDLNKSTLNNKDYIKVRYE